MANKPVKCVLAHVLLTHATCSFYSNVCVCVCVSEEVVDGDMRARAGSRVLCLDGGGIRGLIQVEVLSLVYTVIIM